MEGISILRVVCWSRLPFESSLVPQDFAGEAVEADDLEGQLTVILHRTWIAIVAGLDFRVAADCGGEKNPITPNHRARMAKSRYRCFPQHILSILDFPRNWRILPIGDTSGV